MMNRVTIAEAERDFANLVNKVYSEGIAIELQRGDTVIAHLTPAAPRSRLQVRDLNAFLDRLPKLGEDAETFLEDIRAIRREFPSEASPWP
jgi:antitoxin (DNA-binding transcriptional repressor) of toxin-antitoxin stability system